MASFGMYPVGYEAAPGYDPLTHRLQHSSVPELVDGEWVITKTVVVLTEDQIADATASKAKGVRKNRDAKLTETDWTGMSDVTMASAMTTYRQALRDITDHADFPYLEGSAWPTKP